MDKKQGKIGLGECVKLNMTALKYWFDLYPSMLVFRTIQPIITALTPFVGIYFSARIIDELSGDRNPQTLLFLIVMTIAITALFMLLSYVTTRQINRYDTWEILHRQVYTTIRDKAFSMDFPMYDNPKTKSERATLNNNTSYLRWGFIGTLEKYSLLVGAITTIITSIAFTVSMFTQLVPESGGTLTALNNPWFILAIIVLMLVISALSPIAFYYTSKMKSKISDSLVQGGRMRHSFSNATADKSRSVDTRMCRQDKILLGFCVSKLNPYRPDGVLGKFQKGSATFLAGFAGSCSALFTGFLYVFAGLKSLGGAFAIGSVTQYVGATVQLSNALSVMGESLAYMKNNAKFIKQKLDYLNRPNDMEAGNKPVPKTDKYEIEFKNVSFKYPSAENYSLENINIVLQVGKKMAVVGENGSGKTTFIKLLCRLYDPTEGEILLNGINIKEYNYQEYLKIMSIVFQDFSLFSYKLAEIIAGGSNYDPKRVEECLINAGFSERLKTMPDGIESYLFKDIDKNGVDISGGEAQKIVLARALYRNTPYIILDEPTAALDPIAEAEVYESFDKVVHGKTAVYISHRLSSCKFCDDIIVFDKGEIIQYGIHNDLVKTEGKYQDLWNAQAKYYTDDVKS